MNDPNRPNWIVERSDDGMTWEYVSDFFFAPPAMACYDFLLNVGVDPWIRLRDIEGKVHERAKIKDPMKPLT